MLCAQEIPVPGAPERIIRVMLHVDGAARVAPQHVYLGEAARLRPDLAQWP
jgi:chorismate mutase